jgi:glycosyltransferase involved in cell wall biosynthesis
MGSKVSVIIPNYNHAAYLHHRIDSVLKQTLQPFEIIILDDCSTDSSVEIIQSYVSIHPTIQFIKNDINSGSTFAQWNKGVSLAKGDLIWIAESDDTAAPTFLQNMIPCFNNKEVVIAYCQSYRMNKDNTITGNWKTHTDEFDESIFNNDFVMNGKEYIERFLIHKNTIPNASAAIFKKNMYEKTGGAIPKVKNQGDWLVWLQLLCIGDVGFVSASLNNFRYHEESVIAKSLRLDNNNSFKDWYGLEVRKYFSVFFINFSVRLNDKLIKINQHYTSVDLVNLGFHQLKSKNYFTGWKLILHASLFPKINLGVLKRAIFK